MIDSRTSRVAGRIAALLVFLGTAGLVGSAAQPPEVEEPNPKAKAKKIQVEEEDPKATVKKKIVVEEPPVPPAVSRGTSTPDKQLDELVRGAAEATEPAAREVYARYAIPFDRLTDSKGNAIRIQPIPLFRGEPLPNPLGVIPLDAAGRPQKVRTMTPAEVKRIDYYEELLLAEAEKLQKSGNESAKLDPAESLAVAEKLIAAAVRFHEYARANSYPDRKTAIRQGKIWEGLRTSLAERLREVRLRQLQHAVQASNWSAARAAGQRLLAAYPKDAAIAQEVAVSRIAQAEVLMKSKTFTDQVEARELLDEFETRFPGAGGDAVRKMRRELALEGSRLFERARGFKREGNLVDARNDLTRAAQLDPTIPGLRELQKELGTSFPVLYVGVRIFPERMSPATARFDSEHQVVQLLFEGLLETIPGGPTGTRFRPGAALDMPTLIPGGREFRVRQVPRDRNPQDGFDAHDVIETVKMLRERPELWVSAGMPWLDDLPTLTGAGSLRFAFRHSHPDPRTLFTFRLLPARWLLEQGKRLDDLEFAARPFGTGPYRIHSIPEANTPVRRELAFIDNPHYGRWRDRLGLPHIKEIRLVDLSHLDGRDPLEEFRRGELHIIPDLTPQEMTRILSEGGSGPGGKGRIVTAQTNRRVHLLAINHRRPYLQNKDLRRGLTQAIDREGIIADVFRSGRAEHKRFTAAMTGPFPPGSWATLKGPANQPIPLMNRDQATVNLGRYLAAPGTVPELRLAYMTADPLAETACRRIKDDIEGLFKDAAGDKKMVIALEPLLPRDFLRRVEEEHRYDLAYMPFDYPDDWYPFGLAAFLDPMAADRNGRNVTGFASPGTSSDAADLDLGRQLAALREHRDFSGDLAPRAERIQRMFNESVPFVPLWHLDRHSLVYSGLKIVVDDSNKPVSAHLLDPSVLFHNVARWRLE
jgi:hypothetical protein